MLTMRNLVIQTAYSVAMNRVWVQRVANNYLSSNQVQKLLTHWVKKNTVDEEPTFVNLIINLTLFLINSFWSTGPSSVSSSNAIHKMCIIQFKVLLHLSRLYEPLTDWKCVALVFSFLCKAKQKECFVITIYSIVLHCYERDVPRK